MDFERVKESLQAQFPGQLVLYVGDIAKILGKSEKAISNLMARNSLPFHVKTVGRARCVDIYQVAQWLSSDATLSDEVAGGQAPHQAAKELQPSALLSNILKDRQAHGESDASRVLVQAPTTEPEFGPYAKAILERRKADVRRLQGFVTGLQGMENMGFMLEVLDEMVFGSALARLTYSVTFGNLAPMERDLWANKSKRYFETEQAAAAFAYLRLKDLMAGRGMGGTQLKIEFNDSVVFWCVNAMEAGLQVICNEINLPLQEINR